MSSNEELPSVLSNRVFKVRDWNRLEAYRLDTKIRALESEKKSTYARISLEQREVQRDLLKLKEAASQYRKPRTLAERRLGFALKRSSSDLALSIEKCQQAFIAPQPRSRSDSAPVSLPPLADRAGASTPPSWTEQKFAARRRALEEPQTQLLAKPRSSSFSRNLSPLCGAERPLEFKRKSSSLSSQSSESDNVSEDNVQKACPRALPKSPPSTLGAPPKRLLRRSYSASSISLTPPSSAGRQPRCRELASLSEFDQNAGARAPNNSRTSDVVSGVSKLAAPQKPLRIRQRSQTLPGLSDEKRQDEKLEPLDADCADDSVFE